MSSNSYWRVPIACAAFCALIASPAFAAPFASPGRPIARTAVFKGVVNASSVPQESFAELAHMPREMPEPGFSEKDLAVLKRQALRHAPVPRFLPFSERTLNSYGPDITLGTSFTGERDSASECPFFGGCAPPDGAIAAGNNLEMEFVNTSLAVYRPDGTLKAGWPKNSTAFFHIPAPTPAGCDAAGAFTSDPRLFYDQNDKRWFAEILQVQGQPVGDSCTNTSLYWVAVSRTSDPSGAWNIYAFDMSLGSGDWADFSQVGYDGVNFCFSGNLFPYAGGGFQHAEYFCAPKANMEAGSGVGYSGFVNPTIGGVSLDTVQPVDMLGSKNSLPGVEYFVSAENIDFGGGVCSSGCSEWLLFGILDSNGSVNVAAISTPGYSLAPNADQPSCTACIDTDDPRINGTPAYRDGSIWTAQNTGVNNGSQTVPGLLWTQLFPTLNSSNQVTGGFFLQDGYIFFGGDAGVYYGAMTADDGNNMAMVADYSSNGTSPSAIFDSHRNSDPLGSLNCCFFLKQGSASTFDFRWGDYNSAASDEYNPDTIYLEGEFAAGNGDWSTRIGVVRP